MERKCVRDVQEYLLQKAVDNLIAEWEKRKNLETKAPYKMPTWDTMTYYEKLNALETFQKLKEEILNKEEEK